MVDTTVIVGPYSQTKTEYLPYNPDSSRVAKSLAEIIIAAKHDLQVEHIGSTAVPGCWGMGVIDLLVLSAPGELTALYSVLESIGFQRQSGTEANDALRQLYVGSVEFLGREYGVHVRACEKGDSEIVNLLKFRDLLRGNPGLRRAYEAEKRRVLARGVTIANEYAKTKAEFIRTALAAAEL